MAERNGQKRHRFLNEKDRAMSGRDWAGSSETGASDKVADVLNTIASRAVVPKGNVVYALVVSKAGAQNPIVIHSYDALVPPQAETYFEASARGDRFTGIVEAVRTFVSDTGLGINVTAHVILR